MTQMDIKNTERQKTKGPGRGGYIPENRDRMACNIFLHLANQKTFNMKRISVFLLTAATLAIATIGCNSAGSGGDPKAVLMAFSEKMGKQYFDGAAQLATKESQPFFEVMKKAMEMLKGMKGMMPENTKEQNNFDDVKIGDARINGDVAVVPFTSKGQPTFEFPLKKEGGAWKVDLTSETMAKMGMDTNGADGNSGMNDLKNLNMDTLKKGLEMMDTMMKQLTPEKMKEFEKMGEEMEKKMKEFKQ